MSKRFAGRVAFITGGSRGIGKGVALKFAEEGAKVAIIDINEEALSETKKEFMDKGYEIYTKRANVVNAEEVESAVEEVASSYGSLDILVHNAGIIRNKLIFNMSNNEWKKIMDVNLKVSFNAAKAAQKYMVNHKYAPIINTSSTAALANRGEAIYATAKAGLQGFTKS